jgi:DNA (cytosine-5)-methyltransferase 1
MQFFRMTAFGQYVPDDRGGAVKQRDFKDATDLVVHSLRADGFDASEDGTGRGTPIVPVAFVQNTRDEVRLMGGDGDIVGALPAEPGMKQQSYVAYGLSPDNTGDEELMPTLTQPSISGGEHPAAVAHSLNGNSGRQQVESTYIPAKMAVRRLTPKECERLQGFPDGWTAITYRGKPAADGPRYRAIGNSMAVTVMNWLGKRIQMVEDTPLPAKGELG